MLVVSVVLSMIVSLSMIVWLLSPGPMYVSVYWNAAPGTDCLKSGLDPTPVHVVVFPLTDAFTDVVVGEMLLLSITSTPLPETLN